MKLASSAFDHEGKIPSKYTCDGQNISPPLRIENVPKGAASLILLMDDPDVPKHIRSDGMWDHWVLFNIPISTSDIPEGSVPQSVQGINTSGELVYQGPCPPDREHRYYFKLYALDVELDLPAGVSKVEVEKAMRGHIIEEVVLMGRYDRMRLV